MSLELTKKSKKMGWATYKYRTHLN